jgi:hypothetical protein
MMSIRQNAKKTGSLSPLRALIVLGMLAIAPQARADDATVSIGGPLPSPEPAESWPRRPSRAIADDSFIVHEPELRRSPFRLALGPAAITSGKSFGMGVGLAADFGTGSVGGRLSASWLRGEGKTDAGASTPTGDAVGHYAGEITLDLHKRGPFHSLVGMGAGFMHVSRSDGQSGFAGMGTGRSALEYALGLDDADVRLGTSVTGGVIGPVDREVRDLRAYALADVHLAIGF